MRGVLICGLILLMMCISNFVDHKARTYCQQNETAYEAMMFHDCLNFCVSGGGSFGYNNYFKWEYARWINSPERSIVERILFWNVGFLYDATNPPDKYQYPPKIKKFKKDSWVREFFI